MNKEFKSVKKSVNLIRGLSFCIFIVIIIFVFQIRFYMYIEDSGVLNNVEKPEGQIKVDKKIAAAAIRNDVSTEKLVRTSFFVGISQNDFTHLFRFKASKTRQRTLKRYNGNGHLTGNLLSIERILW